MGWKKFHFGNGYLGSVFADLGRNKVQQIVCVHFVRDKRETGKTE